jgi:hypothetical protein
LTTGILCDAGFDAPQPSKPDATPYFDGRGGVAIAMVL